MEADMAGIQLSTLLNQHMVHNQISVIPACTKNIWLVQTDWNLFISWLISYYSTIPVKYASYNTELTKGMAVITILTYFLNSMLSSADFGLKFWISSFKGAF